MQNPTNQIEPGLIDRGGGLLYDPVLNVTWLQDANYARTTGYHPTGSMPFAEAQKFVSELVYRDTVRNVDLKGWRLPKVTPINGVEFNHQFRVDGMSDEGYNITSPNAELSYMYYVNLGLNGWWTVDEKRPKTFGVLRNWTAMWSGETNLGLIKNLMTHGYWCHSPGQKYPSPAVWVFTTAEGNQRDGMPRPNARYVWPVRDGDVAAAN